MTDNSTKILDSVLSFFLKSQVERCHLLSMIPVRQSSLLVRSCDFLRSGVSLSKKATHEFLNVIAWKCPKYLCGTCLMMPSQRLLVTGLVPLKSRGGYKRRLSRWHRSEMPRCGTPRYTIPAWHLLEQKMC